MNQYQSSHDNKHLQYQGAIAGAIKNIFNQIAVLILSLVCTLGVGTPSVYANPAGGQVAAGDATITNSANHVQINQTTSKAIINWQSFNINNQESTHFQQPAGGVALNRINPAQGASTIYGTLTATGQIILMNPAGLFFGPSAYVNVGGLIATTANMTDQNFLNGVYQFSSVSPYSGAVINQGTIIAMNHGLVALVGNNVQNDGRIQANLGQVVLASGNAFTITFAGNEMISFSLDEKAVNGGVSNTGVLQADGGQILVAANVASGVLDNIINMEGVIQARSIDMQNGEIILSANPDAGVVRVAGTLDVSGKSTGETGGKVTITGHNILIDNLSVIDASGDAGGGDIFIGGNAHGIGPLPNANATVMSQDVILLADAITTGNGGNVVLWSDYVTKAYGTISAKGGALSGDGGFVETSGHYLAVDNITVDTSSPNGLVGTWLLDPYNITINNAAASNMDTATNTWLPTATGAIVNAAALGTALNSNNITISTVGAGAEEGNITFADTSGDMSTNWTSTAGRTLTLRADNNITMQASTVLILDANQVVTFLAGQTTATGNITLDSNIRGLTDGRGTVNMTVGSAGTISVNAGLGLTNQLGEVNFNGSGTSKVILANNIRTSVIGSSSGNQNYNLPVLLNAPTVTLNSDTGNITFGSSATINSLTSTARSLTLTSSGTTTLGAAIGTTNALAVISASAGGMTVLSGGTITTTAAQTYNNPVKLDANTFITISNGNVIFNSTINNLTTTARNLTISTGTGLINLADSIGNNANGPLGAISLNTTSIHSNNRIDGAIVKAASITTNVGGTTSISGGNQTITTSGNITFNDTVFLSGTGTKTLSATAVIMNAVNLNGNTLTINNSAGSLISGDITGNGNLIKSSDANSNGTGTLTLSGVNSYVGTTTINKGTLSLATASALNNTTSTTIADGATLDIEFSGAILANTNPIFMSGSGNGGVGAFTLTGYSSTLNNPIILTGATSIGGSGEGRLNGSITGGQVLTKIGTGTISLGASNILSGILNINSGRLEIADSNALNGLTGVVVTSGSSLQLASVNIFAIPLTLSGVGVEGGALSSAGGSNSTWNGDITLVNEPTIINNQVFTTLLTINGNISGDQALSLTGPGDITINGIISSSGGLTSATTGIVTLAGTNTYSGTTTVSEGILNLTNSGALGATSGVTVTSGTTLQLTNVSISTPLSLSGLGVDGNGALVGSGTSVSSGSIILAGDTTISAQNLGDELTLNGTIDGSQALTLAGSGLITLGGVVGGNTALSSLTSNVALTLGTNITTSGHQIYNYAVTIGSDSILNSSVGNVIFESTIDSDINTENSLTLMAGGGTISLNGIIGGTQRLFNFSATTIGNTGGITVNEAISTSGSLTFNSASGITLNSTLTANGLGNSIVLSGQTFTNNAGSSALNADRGNFLVWSGDPANDNRGGIAYDFKQYNATFGSTIVLGTGNGFLYTLAPLITPSLTGTVTKVYDATTAATLADNNYITSGTIDGDIVFLKNPNNPISGTYDTADVGVNKNISVSDLAIDRATNDSALVYGYQLAATSANADIGTITPAPVPAPIPTPIPTPISNPGQPLALESVSRVLSPYSNSGFDSVSIGLVDSSTITINGRDGSLIIHEGSVMETTYKSIPNSTASKVGFISNSFKADGMSTYNILNSGYLSISAAIRSFNTVNYYLINMLVFLSLGVSILIPILKRMRRRQRLLLKTMLNARRQGNDLSQVSFQLRTILNEVIGFASLVKLGLVGHVTPKQNEFLRDILAESNKLLRDIIAEEASESKIAFKKKSVSDRNFKTRSRFNSIIGMADLLNDGKVGNISIKQQEFLKGISTRSNSLLKILTHETS